MAATIASEIARKVERVADYGGQIAAVFHNFSLSAERVPVGHEGSINIIDSTVTTLKQALKLLNQETSGNCPKLFSEEGLKYVHLLTNECATTLAKIEPLLARACLTPKEAREKRKSDKKNLAQTGGSALDIFELKLDAEAFLKIVELAKWSRVSLDMEQCVERLYDLQLHLLLIFQVVMVGALSRDLSSGKVDVKSIVDYHERITRTADLVGIQPPKGQSKNARNYDESSSDGSSSDSDSSMDLRTARRRVKALRRTLARRSRRPGCPPPPPLGWIDSRDPRPAPFVMATSPNFPVMPLAGDPRTLPSGPPAYEPTSCVSLNNSLTRDSACSVNKPTTPFPIEKRETEFSPKEKVATTKPLEESKPLKPEPGLFKSNTNSFGFKIKSLFRSKQSLAEEMKKALGDSESQLVAYLLQGLDVKQVPHSVFHSLESTHMRIILSQLSGDEWYKIFTTLTSAEYDALGPIIRPNGDDESNSRDIVVLKIVERNSVNAWFFLVKDLFQKYQMQADANRVLLVIVREKLGKKPVSTIHRPRFLSLPVGHEHKFFLRPPPGLPIPTRSISRIIDLRFPPQPCDPRTLHVIFPALIARGPPPPPDLAAEASVPINLDAKLALTVFTEYTLRQIDHRVGPPHATTWSRCQVTQESSTHEHLISRVREFEAGGGDVIELKLRLSEQQSTQISQLMDELKFAEHDQRFEWSWVEISLYTHSGMIPYTDLMAVDQDVPLNRALSATHIHLVAQRTLRPHCIPIRVYNQFMAPPLPPPLPATGQRSKPSPPGWRGLPVIVAGPPPSRARSVSSSSGSGSGSNSDSSSVVSDSSEGGVRRRLRRYRARKVKTNQRIRDRSPVDSDWSGSESEEEEDAIEVIVALGRGGDVVKALLELWTPQGEVDDRKVVG